MGDIYGMLDIVTDEQLAQNEANALNQPPPPIIDNTPTAILRPPPIPIGAPMVGPSVPVVSNSQPPTQPSTVQPPAPSGPPSRPPQVVTPTVSEVPLGPPSNISA